MKNIDHHRARFGDVYRFIDDLIAIDNSNEIDNYFKKTYPNR